MLEASEAKECAGVLGSLLAGLLEDSAALAALSFEITAESDGRLAAIARTLVDASIVGAAIEVVRRRGSARALD